MKKIYSKFISVLCFTFLIVSVFLSDLNNVYGSSFTTKPSDVSDTFSVSYDSSKYTIYWAGRTTIISKCQYGCWWSSLDEGDTLGSAIIRVYYLEPKSAVNGYYYALAGCRVDMNPQKVENNVTGMSQKSEFGIRTISPDSRICSPTVDVLTIQAQKIKSSSNTFTAGAGITYNTKTKAWEPSAEFSFGATWGSSTTYAYNMTNVNLVQKNIDGNYASWLYDYKSKNNDPVWNAYLMSSSKVAGQVLYRIAYPNSSTRYANIPSDISYDIRFGAGDYISGEVADRFGPDSSRDMSIKTGNIHLVY